MKIYKKFEIRSNDNEYKYDYSFRANNLYNTSIQEENEKKFDTLLDGILYNNINSIKIDELS